MIAGTSQTPIPGSSEPDWLPLYYTLTLTPCPYHHHPPGWNLLVIKVRLQEWLFSGISRSLSALLSRLEVHYHMPTLFPGNSGLGVSSRYSVTPWAWLRTDPATLPMPFDEAARLSFIHSQEVITECHLPDRLALEVVLGLQQWSETYAAQFAHIQQREVIAGIKPGPDTDPDIITH